MIKEDENLVIQTNLVALNSHRNMSNISAIQEKTTARLSSGLKINSASDDASGLAISEKMRAQIRGLDMASKNSQDAQSLIQTAEGGMQEIDNILQRVRELTVQAANDTNEYNSSGTGDRNKIQGEIKGLVSEIDSMAERVEFNKKKLINGDLAGKADQTTMDNLTTATTEKEIARTELVNWTNIEPNKSELDALENIITGDHINSFKNYKQGPLVDESVDSNIPPNYVSQGSKDEFQAVYDKVAKALDMVKVAKSSDEAKAGEALVDEALQQITAFETTLPGSVDKDAAQYLIFGVMDAKDAFGAFGASDRLTTLETTLSDKTTTYNTAMSAYKNAPKEEGLYFQVGANANQSLKISIGSLKSDFLGIGNGSGDTNIDLLKESGKDITSNIDVIDNAISYVTTERSKLGGIQNRLDYTIKSLDISSENLSAAESRIRDTDMAKEMMNLTKANVLSSAAQSMVAQANQAPQGVLQLLR